MPFETDPQAKTSAQALAEALAEAKKLLDEGMYEICLDRLRQLWLSCPNSYAAMMLLAKLLSEVKKGELARKIEALAAAVQAHESQAGQRESQPPTDFGPAAGNAAGSAAAASAPASDQSQSWKGRHSPRSLEETLEGSLARTAETQASLHQRPDRAPGKDDGSESQSGAGRDLAYLYFEVGFGLIDIRQYELASMLLKRCLRISPDEPTVCYELAFALMSAGKPREAIPYFEEALAHTNDFDTNLNLAVCHMLSRQVEEAQQVLDRMPSLAVGDDEKKELAHRKVVLRRLRSMSQRAVLSRRDWLYILYGTAIVRPAYKPAPASEDFKAVASMLAVLKGVLEGVRGEIEAVEYYSPKSRPLARILAELMELPFDSYKGPDRPDRALLVMVWATDVIGPHESFVANLANRSIFAYGLSVAEPLPVVPDLVGCLASELIMPWEDGIRQDSVDTVIAKITDRARALESDPDILGEVQDGVEYYDAKRELLVFNNSAAFPERPEYTAEVESSG